MTKRAKHTQSIGRLAVRTLMATKPADLVKVLRPPELTYLCELCAELQSLRICDDVFFEDEEEDECPD